MARKLLTAKPLGPNSIRAWREHRNLTLERVADRVRDLGLPITPSSLSRIERRVQPYSQPVLEALADALQCEPSDLVARQPPSDDEVALFSMIRGMPAPTRHQALRILKALGEAA